MNELRRLEVPHNILVEVEDVNLLGQSAYTQTDPQVGKVIVQVEVPPC